jgi:hypothetical protein
MTRERAQCRRPSGSPALPHPAIVLTVLHAAILRCLQRLCVCLSLSHPLLARFAFSLSLLLHVSAHAIQGALSSGDCRDLVSPRSTTSVRSATVFPVIAETLQVSLVL